MTRDEAVRRIDATLGWKAAGHGKTADIVLRLQEAQRDLEKGKTLPRFLVQEDQTLTLPVGAHDVALPTGFLRADDDNPLFYVADDSHLRHYLTQYRYYRDAVKAVESSQRPDQPAQTTDAPSVYVIRKSTVDFITFADREYVLSWSYYKRADLLTSNIENLWLANVPELVIGEAGMRIAADFRDMDAIKIFEAIKAKALNSMLSEIYVSEDAAGPIAMGANN